MYEVGRDATKLKYHTTTVSKTFRLTRRSVLNAHSQSVSCMRPFSVLSALLVYVCKKTDSSSSTSCSGGGGGAAAVSLTLAIHSIHSIRLLTHSPIRRRLLGRLTNQFCIGGEPRASLCMCAPFVIPCACSGVCSLCVLIVSVLHGMVYAFRSRLNATTLN